MRTFSDRSKADCQVTPAHAVMTNRAKRTSRPAAGLMSPLPHAVGRRDEPRLPVGSGRAGFGGATAPQHFAQDFSRIPIGPHTAGAMHAKSAMTMPGYQHRLSSPLSIGVDTRCESSHGRRGIAHAQATELSTTGLAANATRNADDLAAAEGEITANGTTPAPAPGVTPPVPAPPPTPAAPARNCHVSSGPTYTPNGTIPVRVVGGRKSASFRMAAAFSTSSSRGRVPACCEVRQYIKWNRAYHTWRGGPPHSGFPSSATYNTWYEDRDSNDKRYGHRSGVHSDPIARCGDEYKTGSSRDQANGNTYCGRDSPQSGAPAGATYNFQLKVIDTCNGNANKASSSVITVNW